MKIILPIRWVCAKVCGVRDKGARKLTLTFLATMKTKFLLVDDSGRIASFSRARGVFFPVGHAPFAMVYDSESAALRAVGVNPELAACHVIPCPERF